MKPMRLADRIREQGKAFARMHGPTLCLIEKHAAEFEIIIKSYHQEFGRSPTADDILWIACEHAGRDLTQKE